MARLRPCHCFCGARRTGPTTPAGRSAGAPQVVWFILIEIMSQEQVPQLSGYSEAVLDAAFGALASEVEHSAQSLASPEDVDQFRLQWLGRKQGRLKSVSDAWLKSAPPEAKRQIGQRFNRLKELIEQQSGAGGYTGNGSVGAGDHRHHAAGNAAHVGGGTSADQDDE